MVPFPSSSIYVVVVVAVVAMQMGIDAGVASGMGRTNGGNVNAAAAAASGGGGVLMGAGLVGRTVCKEFPFGPLEGKVAFAHRPNGEALLFRVVRKSAAVG